MISVAKFGGSSVADSKQFAKVKGIIFADDKRRVVVVSAPGKRYSGDSKITDLLYLLYAHKKYNIDGSAVFNTIYERYSEIKTALNLKLDLEKEFNTIQDNLSKGATEEYLVSRGEYLCAKLMAEYLGYEFADSMDLICFNYDGTVDNEKTLKKIAEKFESANKLVVPGFYGAYPSGEIKLFSRGGSDITGSIMASGVGADKYENWTDVSGILVTDPKIVNNPKRIEEITYDELRELSYMGASVLHEETVFPVQELNIPIYILNTNRPLDEGTKICKDAVVSSQAVTGIAGKKNFKAFTIVKSFSADKLKVIRDALNVFEKFGVSVEHIPTAIDSFNVIVESKAVERKVYDIIGELKRISGVISVEVDSDLALVAVVGRNMVTKAGISGKIFSLFGSNGINIKTIAQGTKEITIIVGVSNSDFEKSIQVVYDYIVK